MLHAERLEPPVAAAQGGRTLASSAAAAATAASAVSATTPTSSSAAAAIAPTEPKKKKTKIKAPYKDLERRREQNRVNAQKSYYRKLNVLDALRTEVAALEERYQTQMQTLKSGPAHFRDETALFRDRNRLTSDPALEQRSASFAYHNVNAADDAVVTYRRRLHHLATEHDALKDEHRMLQAYHDLHVKFQCRAQLVVDLEHPTSVAELFGTRSEARRARVLAELRVRCPAQMQRPLDVDECRAIGLDVYAKIRAFAESESHASTGGAVCGWEGRRCVEDGLLKFSLQKRFPNVTVHELAARTWPVLASPAKLRSFYSDSMKMHCEVAQRVDASNVVLYQEYEARERDLVVLVRSLLLVTLIEIADGYAVLFYDIDPSRLQERDEAEALASVGVSDRKEWRNRLNWCVWQEAGGAGEHSSSAFVGAVPAERGGCSYWPVEVLLMSMRWEHEVVGASFLLRSEDAPEHLPAPADSRHSSVRFGSWTQLPTTRDDPSVLIVQNSVRDAI